jgi:hypothetical protein
MPCKFLPVAAHASAGNASAAINATHFALIDASSRGPRSSRGLNGDRRGAGAA